MRAVLLYGSETWALRAEDTRRLTVFDNRCLRSIARVRWQHRVSTADVHQRVLGADVQSLKEIVPAYRLC